MNLSFFGKFTYKKSVFLLLINQLKRRTDECVHFFFKNTNINVFFLNILELKREQIHFLCIKREDE